MTRGRKENGDDGKLGPCSLPRWNFEKGDIYWYKGKVCVWFSDTPSPDPYQILKIESNTLSEQDLGLLDAVSKALERGGKIYRKGTPNVWYRVMDGRLVLEGSITRFSL